MPLTKRTILSLSSGASLSCLNEATKSRHLPSTTNLSTSSVNIGQLYSESSGHIDTKHVAARAQRFANRASLRFSKSESKTLEEFFSFLTLGVDPAELVISWITIWMHLKSSGTQRNKYTYIVSIRGTLILSVISCFTVLIFRVGLLMVQVML